MGEAGLHLIAGVLGTDVPEDEAAADAQRVRVLHYVRTHLADSDLTHDRVAAAHRMAPRTLHRLFEHEPYTITEYIRLQRLEAAHRDLADPLFQHLSIARVAARWRFISPAHFTRAFQARYGVPPSTIRREAP
jgi:transcriptional regulator GlxA family with amidase domain